MAHIYTISHPFTNEVVYVGCTKNITNRTKCHIGNKTDSDLANWIQSLLANYTLPKIESIEIVSEDDMLYFEGYWIQQFQIWGFNLFNKSKTIGAILRTPKKPVVKLPKIKKEAKYFVKKTPEQWAAERQARAERKELLRQHAVKSRKWNLDNFEIGREYRIKKDDNARRSFKEMFRQYAHKHKIECRLSETVLEEEYLLTVIAGKRVCATRYGKTKSGKPRYIPLMNKPKVERRPRGEKFTWGFDVAKVGDRLDIPFNKFASFLVCFGNYKKRHGLQIKLKHSFSACNTFLIIEYVGDGEIINNPSVPLHLIRKTGNTITTGARDRQSKLSDSQKQEVINSNISIRELAIEYDVSEATIYKLKNPKKPNHAK